MTSWLELQLADSAFPAGGFAHSGGLEAAVKTGLLDTVGGVEAWLHDALWQAGHASLPFVAAAHHAPAEVRQLDTRQDTALPSPVLNRASRRQGRAHLSACRRSFGGEAITTLCADLKDSPTHLAPAFGASLAALGLEREATLRLHLHGVARGALSAAVRLALIGPAEAQRLQLRAAPTLDAVMAACATLGVTGQCQTAPLHELAASGHDTLYSRLFTS